MPALLHGNETPAAAIDQALQGLQHRYYTEDKHRQFDDAGVLAYAREAQTQRLKPEAERDWHHATALWTRVQIDPLPYDRKAGDLKSAQIYITTAGFAPLLTIIPALMTLATKATDLKEHAIAKAAESFAVQGAMVVATPVLMAFLRVMLLPAMENVRQGSPMRSKEMKTRDLARIVADMKTAQEDMATLTGDMHAAQATLRTLQERGEAPSEAFKASLTALGERMVAHSQKVNDLSLEYVTKRDTDQLNDVFTTWRTRVGMLQVGANLIAGVIGTATKNARIAAGVQVAGTATAMAASQGVTAPYHALFGTGPAPTRLVGAGVNDDALKQDATIFATASSSNILKPAARAKAPEAITLDDIDLSDFKKQWKGPLGVGVAQVEEYLAFNIKIKEQEIDALLGLRPGESKKSETLAALAQRTAAQDTRLADIDARKKTLVPQSDEHDAFVQLVAARDDLQRSMEIVSAGTGWERLPPEVKTVLHDALADDHFAGKVRNAMRLGALRFAQPSDFLPQFAQLAGAAAQLWFIAGRAFPLLTQAAFRLAGAPAAEEGKPSPIPDAVRYVISGMAAAAGVWGAMKNAHLIREKVAQRNEMRAMAAEQGEKLGIRQNVSPENMVRLAHMLVRAINASVTGTVRQHRAATAARDVARDEASARELSEALIRTIDDLHLAGE